MKKRPLIAATALLAIALAGCGGSSKTSSSAATSNSSSASSSTPTTSSTTAAGSTSSAAANGGTGSFKSGFAADKVQFRALGANLQKALTQAGSKTDAQLATELSQLSDQAKAQAQRLSQLNPPAKFKTALDNLVNSLNNVSSDLKSISDAATKHDATAAKAATEKLVADAAKVKSSDTQLTNGLRLSAS
ncbi:MAG TPA: hypothetical protein VGL51_00445 [Solirubrobacteraceae bacterium]